MQQMASRPFATINVALEMDEEPPDLIGGNVKVSMTFRVVTSEWLYERVQLLHVLMCERTELCRWLGFKI